MSSNREVKADNIVQDSAELATLNSEGKQPLEQDALKQSVEVVGGGSKSWVPAVPPNEFSLDLDGTVGTSASIASAAEIDDLVNFSANAWINTTNPNSGIGVVWGQSDVSPVELKWWFGMNNGVIRWTVSSAGGFNDKLYETVAGGYNDGSWHMISMTYASNDLKVYVDGVEITGGALSVINNVATGNLFNTTADLRIGGLTNGPNDTLRFTGRIDEVSYFQDVLTGAEITELYNSGQYIDISTTTFAADCSGWWRCGDGDSAPFLTDNINSNDATLGGNALFDTGDAVPAVGTGPGQFSFDAALQLELPGLQYADNNIPTSESPFVLPGLNDVVYVVPNLTSGGGNLSVSVDTLDNVPENALVIGRRDDEIFTLGSSERFDNSVDLKFLTKSTSEFRMNTPSGYGSTNVAIRTYSNLTQAATFINYTSDGVNGDSFTVLEDGLYFISVVDAGNGVATWNIGLSLNSANLTTGVNALPDNERLGTVIGTTSLTTLQCSVVTWCEVGDIIRVHGETAGARAQAAFNYTGFRIIKML